MIPGHMSHSLRIMIGGALMYENTALPIPDPDNSSYDDPSQYFEGASRLKDVLRTSVDADNHLIWTSVSAYTSH